MTTLATRVMRPSGLGWAPRVPADWDVAKICLVARLESGHTPSRQQPEYWVPEECTIPWFSLADVWQLREGRQKYLGDTAEMISPRGMANSAARLLPAGTVVLSRTASVGFSGIMPRPMATTQDFANWVPGERILPEFLLYALRAMSEEFRRATMGSTHQTIYMPDIRRLAMPIPTLDEQRRIADFLDRKTKAIDDLIERKIKLLARQLERRDTYVAELFGHGLKPGRVVAHPVLGSINAEWEARPLKHLSPSVTVGIVVTPAKYYADTGVPCLRSLNVKPGRLHMEPLVFISEASNGLLSKSQIRSGDLVCVRTGQPGTTAVVPSTLNGANCIDLIIVRRSERFDSEYLCAYMNSATARRQYGEGSEGALQLHFNVETAKNLIVPTPPVQEQRRIAEHLRATGEAHERGVAAMSTSIDRLREYRQSLITAAVTGQLAIP